MSIWNKLDAARTTASKRAKLRRTDAEKYAGDVIRESQTRDSYDHYSESRAHKSLGNGGFVAINMIGDAGTGMGL